LEEAPARGSLARALAWRLLTRGALVPLGPDLEEELLARFGARAAVACAELHRLQCAALLAGPAGRPARLSCDLGGGGRFSTAEAQWLAETARGDVARLRDDLGLLYPGDGGEEDEPLQVRRFSGGRPGLRAAWTRDGGEEREPYRLEAEPVPFVRDDAALARLARRLLGVPSLRPGQAEGVAALLSGRDLSCSAPTGAGKSLVFQLALLLAPGTALIVAPLRALLRDQRRRLAEAGVSRVGLLVGDDRDETRRALAALESGRLLACLAAPERLDSSAFRRALRGAVEGEGVPFVAVDEAQCAARRGPDWRPAYRALGARLRGWTESPERATPLAAFSGTASPGAVAEAERVLALAAPVRVSAGAARPNLSFRVWTSAASDHRLRLRELLTRLLPEGRTGPGIVFCPRVDGPLGAADVAAELAREGLDAAAYTGRAPAGAEPAAWEADKRRAAEDFLAGRRGLLCATRAFGLGVDRADVRFTVHLGLPASLEEFYQQAGRAGRDGRPAACWVLLQCASERRARRWLDLPLEDLRAELGALRAAQRDDVARACAFHLAAFPGEAVERRDAELALAAAGDPAQPGEGEASLPGEDAEALTRALLRFEEAGVLTLRERRRAGWLVRRAGGWSEAQALAAAEARIERDYRAVEPSRRASLAELVELSLSPDPGAALSERLAVSSRYSASYASSAGPQDESLAIAVARAVSSAPGVR
ncbi:MAG: ATP-dependent DNA helicase RecQ, partial [Elusimicrobia bacterium]|nr:ATP-dependent DNA helicase RecQ [Elusimicrobiota bacterium]